MSNSHKDIEKKKLELEAKMAKLQHGLDHSLDEVKGDVANSLSPKELVRKYPLPVIGLSLALGFILGSSGGKKHTTGKVKGTDDDVVSSISRSLKKRLAQKAIDTALDYVEQKLSERTSPPGE